jgi:dTDP-4-dehydrorhamnose reductase
MKIKPRRVLVLGGAGMLGNAMLRIFSQNQEFELFASVRSSSVLNFLSKNLHQNILTGVDVENADSLKRLFAYVQPDIVVNCIGLIKQLVEVNDPLAVLPINSILPHRLARLCEVCGARLIHISTDCVFSGERGMYTELDVSDANDLYGRSKYLGEVDYPNAITIRTSIIGHELRRARSLVDWFLAQEGSVKGFKRAIFSGLPTVEIASIIRDYVIPHKELHGVYNVSAEPINKYDLLHLVAKEYGKAIKILPDEEYVIDRSLDSSRFRTVTGYNPPEWSKLIALMHEFMPIKID